MDKSLFGVFYCTCLFIIGLNRCEHSKSLPSSRKKKGSLVKTEKAKKKGNRQERKINGRGKEEERKREEEKGKRRERNGREKGQFAAWVHFLNGSR